MNINSNFGLLRPPSPQKQPPGTQGRGQTPQELPDARKLKTCPRQAQQHRELGEENESPTHHPEPTRAFWNKRWAWSIAHLPPAPLPSLVSEYSECSHMSARAVPHAASPA